MMLCSIPSFAATVLLASFALAATAFGKDMDEPITFMKNSGWCWYQDPRAILHEGKVIIGGVEGNGRGAAVIGVYDLKEQKILGRTVVHESFDRDDHNSPVFHARPDGSLLAVYARHNRDRIHHYRISDRTDCLKWGKAQQFKHDYPTAANVTYMNLYSLSEEKRLYNFFRGINFNPCFMTSSDHGKTWNTPVHFIQNEIKGRHRPYARYRGNGKDTIHVSFTDGHPRQFGNSIYYAAFRNGTFYKADGSAIKTLQEGGPLRPGEAQKIFQGGGGPGRGGQASAEKSAWISSIALDSNGHPHLGYSYYLSNTDQRYRLASWNGTKWVDREVAYAGKCLYNREASYTGLIALDPADPTRVVIASDVDPGTGKDTGGTHEIYSATVGPDDTGKTIQWTPLTQDTPKEIRNIRPMILNKDGYRIILWQRGRFKTYTDYTLDTVGIIQTK